MRKILGFLNRLYIRWVESLLYKNWFNPLSTLYINFRCFPLKQAIKIPLFAYGWPKLFSLAGKMEISGTCKTGLIKLNQTNTGAPSNPLCGTALNIWGKIIFKGKAQIFSSCKINVLKNATLEVGENIKIMHFCNITAHNKIAIGRGCLIAHRSQIMDSNFHYIADYTKRHVFRYYKSVTIGDFCWICNSCSISGGSIIPSKTIIASNSMVNKDLTSLPEGSIIGGIPAKLLKKESHCVYNPIFEHEITLYFQEHPEARFYPIPEDLDSSVCYPS